MPTVSKGFIHWMFQGGATIEDFADRLNHFWTFGIVLLLAAIIGTRQGTQEPISCWVPAEFSNSMASWTKSHCWNSHIIRLHRDRIRVNKLVYSDVSSFDHNSDTKPAFVSSDFPRNPSLSTKLSTSTTLYQWIPLILFFKALAFKLPSVLFYLIHGFSGVSFDKLSRLTDGYERLHDAERQILAIKISRYLYNWCNQVCFVLPWRLLTIAWLLTKAAYCVNVGIQFRQLDMFIRTTNPPFDNSTTYGNVIFDNLFTNNGTAWKTSPVFPRHILCDFRVRMFTNVHLYTVTCDLPQNEFAEVAFMLLWVWFLFVSIVTSLSLATWLVRIFVPVFRQRYILNLLTLNEDFTNVQSHEVSRFANWLGEDCAMALKIITSNSSALVASNVVCHMWKKRQQAMSSDESPEYRYQPGPSTGPVYQMQAVPEHAVMASAPPLSETAVGDPPSYPGLDKETKI